MTAVNDTVLRFGDVVYAIDTTPKALRNWLQRGQVKLASPKPEEGWREFSYVDVAILALTRSIVDFGVQVEEASNLAHTILTYMQGEAWTTLKNVPPTAISIFWVNKAVLIARDGETWNLMIWNRWEEFPEDFPPAIIIIPEHTLRAALTRAMEIAGENEHASKE